MKYVRMPGVPQPVSALALGTASFLTGEAAKPVCDAYVAAGGDLFDTAWMYQAGKAEVFFGDWMAERGLAGKFTLIVKGAHTPQCHPEAIGRQLAQSFERLRVDRAGIYMMHRDNPKVPAGEFVDAIVAEVEAGRIVSYGFSNWTLERFESASAYAAKRGCPLPTAISNNFSLASMIAPVWEGCVAASDEAWRARLSAGDLGLYAWSSQARGFFTGKDADDMPADPEIARCWSSGRNIARRKRAFALARERGVSGNQMALAYCLHQGFPMVSLIGSLNARELEDSLGALAIDLSPADLRRLEA